MLSTPKARRGPWPRGRGYLTCTGPVWKQIRWTVVIPERRPEERNLEEFHTTAVVELEARRRIDCGVAALFVRDP